MKPCAMGGARGSDGMPRILRAPSNSPQDHSAAEHTVGKVTVKVFQAVFKKIHRTVSR